MSILAGYPGSVAATWQQIGRAGRRQGTSVAVLVASGAPVDQYVIHHPEFLLEGTPEEARLDPDNLHVLLAHLRAATFELPFEPGEVFGPGAGRRPARVPRRGGARPPGRRRALVLVSENFPASEISLRTAAPGERRDHRHDAGSAAGPRRGGPVQRPGPRPRAGDLHPRVGPVPRRPARLGRAQGVRPQDRRRPLHLREPGGDAQAARGVRRGAGDRRDAQARRGDGREPRDAVQEAQVRHRRERRLGADRPAGARAPDDRVLAHRGPRPRALAARRAGRRAARRRASDPDGRVRAADGRPTRPGTRHPGPLPARGGADDLPVRGRARRDRAVGAAVAAPRRAARRCGRPDRRVRLRRRLPGLHRPAPGTRCRRAAGWRSGCSASSGPAPGSPRPDDRRRSPNRAIASPDASRDSGPPTPVRAPPDDPLPLSAAREPRAGAAAGRRRSTARSSRPTRACTSASRRPGSTCRSTATGWRRLPGQPPADGPLVCLDTETTGLATAAGTVAFLIGLGWWTGDDVPPGPAAAARPRRGRRPARPAWRATSRPTPGS